LSTDGSRLFLGGNFGSVSGATGPAWLRGDLRLRSARDELGAWTNGIVRAVFVQNGLLYVAGASPS